MKGKLEPCSRLCPCTLSHQNPKMLKYASLIFVHLYWGEGGLWLTENFEFIAWCLCTAKKKCLLNVANETPATEWKLTKQKAKHGQSSHSKTQMFLVKWKFRSIKHHHKSRNFSELSTILEAFLQTLSTNHCFLWGPLSLQLHRCQGTWMGDPKTAIMESSSAAMSMCPRAKPLAICSQSIFKTSWEPFDTQPDYMKLLKLLLSAFLQVLGE